MEYNDDSELIGFSLRPKVIEYMYINQGFEAVTQVIKGVIGINQMLSAV